MKKQKSGSRKRKDAEDKARTDLANRPGQLKISNWFKEPNVLPNQNEISPEECSVVNFNTVEDPQIVGGQVVNKHTDEIEKEEDIGVANAFESDEQNEESIVNSKTVEAQETVGGLFVDTHNEENNGAAAALEIESQEQSVDHKVCDRCDLSVIANRRLTVDLLVNNFECLQSFKKSSLGRQRPYISCNVCKEFEDVAKKYAYNHTVPIANGIKVDCQEKLQRVVEHLEGNSHRQAVLAKKKNELWKARSELHVWRKFLNSENEYLVQELTKMAVDVYNDALHGTLPCFNWASRSLAFKRSEQLLSHFSENGFDADLPIFQPSEKMLRYRNPSGYNEMLEIISDLELAKIVQRINNCVCYSIQVDGSVDRSQSDNKFTTLRFIESDGTLQNVFLSVTEPKNNGAKGLLEAVMTAIKKVIREKLASITTDGESANSGPDQGLWKLLEIELGRKILAVWCTCHRSDLALEDMEDEVPALKLWKSNTVALSTYFRTSKCRTKIMHECGINLNIDLLAFPAHNEIRFAEHGENLLKAIIRNLPACRKVWNIIVESNDYSCSAKDKSKASNLLHTWASDTLQFKLTAFMRDVYSVFTSLQKGLQKSNIVMPDVLTLRDAAARKFDIIISGPTPGGEEEKAIKMIPEKNSTIRSHIYSSTNDKSEYERIRNKVAELSKHFLSQRLNIDQENSIQLIKNILTAKSCATLIKHSVDALKQFGEDQDKVATLVNDICEQWPVLVDIPHIETSNIGCKYSVRLRQMFVKSRGQFQWLLGAFAVTSPHSMTTERVVSL